MRAPSQTKQAHACMHPTTTYAAPPRACNRPGRVGAFYFNFLSNVTIALWNENTILYVFVKKRAAFVVVKTQGWMFLSKRERPTGGKKWTWTRPFARPRPSSTSDEGGSAVPNSRLITAVIWISRIPMGITAGPLGSAQTTTTAPAMRQKTRPPRNQTRAEWEMEWKARRKRWGLWRAIVSIMSGELRSSGGFAVVTRRTAPVG